MAAIPIDWRFVMNSTMRNVFLAIAVAALGIAPAAAFGKHGADDGPARQGDDKGGLRDDRGGNDDRGGDNRSGGAKRGEKRVTGSCTGRSSAKLKAKPDDGRLEVEFEVDQNRNGVAWTVRISRDGKLAVSTRASTRAPSGSFSVERRIGNPAGSDRIAARATSPSGEICKASLTI
jgi:hypothetical protein